MAKQINLIPKISEEEIKASTLRKRYSIASTLILLIGFLSIAGIFAYKNFLTLSVNQLDSETKTYVKELEIFKTNESVLKGIELKLAKYSSINNHYPEISNLMDKLKTSVGNSVFITNMEIANESNINVSLISPEKQSLEVLIDGLISEPISTDYKDFEIVNLEAPTGKNYTATLKFKWRGNERN